MIRGSIDAIDVDLLLSDLTAPAAVNREIAAFAANAIAEVDQVNARAMGRPVAKVVTVDGRQVALDRARPGSVIVAEWDLALPAIEWIWRELRDRSPLRSGRYRQAHRLLADGLELAFGAAVPAAQFYRFVNRELYAHKVEIGKTESGRDFVIQVPNRIYQRVALRAVALFGAALQIEFDGSGKFPEITVKPRG